MWGIDNPINVYNYLNIVNGNIDFNFQMIALMKESKYLSFSPLSRTMLESISGSGFSMSDRQIKSPDNPAEMINAKIIKYIR